MIFDFGSSGFDLIGRVSRIPSLGETVPGSTFSTAPGNKGANQALAARRAGRPVKLVAATGSDEFSDGALRLMREGDVDLSGVKVVPGQTGIAMILVDDAGDNVIGIFPGANGTMTAADADTGLAAMSAGDILLTQQEIPQAATRRALELAREKGVTSILNSAPFLKDTAAIAPLASIVVANETEFALLTGAAGSTTDEAVLRPEMERWARTHGQTIIVTLGGEGARAATPDSWISVPAHKVVPVDTVGAGDTFTGYLAAGLDAGLGLEAAMRRAAVAASLACLTPGAQPAIPHDVEVAAVLTTS